MTRALDPPTRATLSRFPVGDRRLTFTADPLQARTIDREDIDQNVAAYVSLVYLVAEHDAPAP